MRRVSALAPAFRRAAVLVVGAALLAACGASQTVTSPSGSTQPNSTSSTSLPTTSTTSTAKSTTTTSQPTTTQTTTETSGYPTTPTTPGTPPPSMPQPTASHPLTLLVIGDSLGEDLGFGLDDVFGSNPAVRVIQDGIADTGLARPDFYDWQTHLAQEMEQYHPGAVVVMLGGNDGQNFISNGTFVTFGTATWHTVYSQRAAALMNEATAAGAHVVWVGMPIMGDAGLSSEMFLENQAFAQQAATRSGVSYFSSWNVFVNSQGEYSQYLPNASGAMEEVRDSDGVHFTIDGCLRLASAMVGPMEQAFGVTLKT